MDQVEINYQSPVDITNIADVYCVGEQPMERWRVFIDVKNWDPKEHHDFLATRRAYHARIVYEATLLLSFTHSNWLSVPTFEMIRDTAHFEMRSCELESAYFELSCGTIGVNLNATTSRRCFEVSVILYTNMMWVFQKCSYLNKVMKVPSTDEFTSMLLNARALCPYVIDPPTTRVRHLFKTLYYIVKFIKEMGSSRTSILQTFGVDILANKFKSCILALDEILIVI